jgi:hypothetical protein
MGTLANRILILAAVAGPLGPIVTAGNLRICAIAVQNRSERPQDLRVADERLVAALRAESFDAVSIRFAPPAGVDEAAGMAGCGYLLYTDLVRLDETAGSRVSRVFRRVVAKPAATPGVYRAEVEFRIYPLDVDGPPLLSTTLAAKSNGRDRRGSEADRLTVDFRPTDDDGTAQLKVKALDAAFAREASALREHGLRGGDDLALRLR